MSRQDFINTALAGIVIAALIASGIAPYDRLTWLMEVAPVLIALLTSLAVNLRMAMYSASASPE